MGFVKCALPPRHIARGVSTVPFVRLMSNKSGRKLMLSPRVLEGSGLARGDQLVLEYDEEARSHYRIRRAEEGEASFGILSQSKKDRYGTFATAGSILLIDGYAPGQVTAEYGEGWVLFDAIGLPKPEPIADPPEPKPEPWTLTTSPKVTIQVVRALVDQKPEERIERDLLLKPHELAAIKAFVTSKQIATVRARSKPGQEQWFTETEEKWTRRQRTM